MNTYDRPPWKLPQGVSRGLWEYVHTPHIAEDYDNYFAYNRLFEFDEQILAKYFVKERAWVADLGCGTGRALAPLAQRGLQGLAIDLSESMLHIVQEKADIDDLPIWCVRCNLAELDGFADSCVDYAMCLFSTLGMIRGSQHRANMLAHVSRMLKPGGLFIAHAHNRHFLFDTDGPWWLLKNWRDCWLDRRIEVGDKWFHYRGVSNMYLHLFSQGEFKRLIRGAGFRIVEWIPLNAPRNAPLRKPGWFGGFRANGFLVVAEKR